MYGKIKTVIVIVAIVIFAAANVMSCGAAQTSNLKYNQVTGQSLVEECTDPVEVHNVPPIRFPIPAQVSRHHNCMGVGDLLAIAYPLDDTAVNIAAANLLGLMYVEYENRNKADTKLIISHIKNDKYDADGTKINVAFFELTEVTLEKVE